MKKRIVFILCGCLLLIALTVCYGFWENTALELNTVTVFSQALPDGFDGFRIAHVSDLHSAQMGTDNVKLLDMLRRCAPDAICITGDLMDSRDKEVSVAVGFVQEAVKIAPCYYITGNHEARLSPDVYDALLEGLSASGVTVLDDREVILDSHGQSISITGHFWGDTQGIGSLSQFSGYRILLSHQPEDLEQYASAGYDLVLSGHAHGGQFRLPWLGGVIAPGQGLFPKYDSGLYHLGKTDMVVSRGIGNSSFPFRLNNPPEVVLIILEKT